LSWSLESAITALTNSFSSLELRRGRIFGAYDLLPLFPIVETVIDLRFSSLIYLMVLSIASLLPIRPSAQIASFLISKLLEDSKMETISSIASLNPRQPKE